MTEAETLEEIDKLRVWSQVKRHVVQSILVTKQPESMTRAELTDYGVRKAEALENFPADDGRIAAVGQVRIYDPFDRRWFEAQAWNFTARHLMPGDPIAVVFGSGRWLGFDPDLKDGEQCPPPGEPLSLFDGASVPGQVNNFSAFSQENPN